MKQKEPIGKYIQKKLRSKKIEDKEVGTALNIAKTSASKIYTSELTPERIAKISILLDEDVYFDYYKDAEGIGPIVRRKVEDLSEKIKALENIIFEKERLIQNQAELIESLRSSK